MKILVIAPQPFFTPRGTPFSVYYRTLVLAEQGASIDLLAYGQGEDVDLPSTRIVRIPDLKFLGPIPIGPSWKKLFLDFFMILWTIGLLIRHRYSVVHAHEEAIFWCRILKPIFRFKLIYDMHSSLPQQLTNFRFTKSSALIRVFKWLEDSALRKSDVVITICPDLQDYALSSGVNPQRHLLIENSIFDDVRVRARKDAEKPGATVASLDLTQLETAAPLIVYAGTFEAYQGIDIVIRAFDAVRRQRPDARLLLVGGTPAQLAQMQSLAQELSLGERVIFTGRVSKGEAMRLTGLATIVISPRRYGTNTPLKIYEQLASGKPLVATRIWSHTQVLTDEVCVLVEPEPTAMADGLLRLLDDPALASRLALRAQELYAQKYSRPVYVQKIRRLVELLS
jgi:glycosyltransferase involved in cell wall biosynthesis